MRAAAYCRYSSENQRDGYSIEAQLSAIRDYCAKEGIELVAEYIDEARSGTNAEREAFQRMISDAEDHSFDLVIVHKLDRFSRDRYDFAVYRRLLSDYGVALRSVLERIDDSPESIITEGMLESMAEYYSRNLSRETKKGLYARVKNGLASSRPPFGYRLEGGHYVPDEEEAPVIQSIYSRIVAGESPHEIGKTLTAKGKRGGRLKGPSVIQFIRNPIYRGVYRYGGTLYKNFCEPLVSDEEWEEANAVLDETKRGPTPRHRQDDYPLTGIMFCGLCGSHFRGTVSRNGKYRHAYYICSKHAANKCPMRRVRKEKIERFVLDCIREDIFEGRAIPELVASLNVRMKEREHDLDLSKAKAELAELRAKHSRLMALYVDGKLDKAMLEGYMEPVEKRIRELEALTKPKKAKPAITEETLRKAVERYFEEYRTESLPRLFSALVERVTVWQGKIEIIYKLRGLKSEKSFALKDTEKVPRLAISAIRAVPYNPRLLDIGNAKVMSRTIA